MEVISFLLQWPFWHLGRSSLAMFFFFITASLSSSDYWLFFVFCFLFLFTFFVSLSSWMVDLRCGRGCDHDLKIPRLQSIPMPGSQESGEPFQLHLCSWWLEKSILEYQSRRMPNWQIEWGSSFELGFGLGLGLEDEKSKNWFCFCFHVLYVINLIKKCNSRILNSTSK